MSELITDKLTTRDGSNVGAIVVADIDELLLLNTNKEINTTAIVKDSNRGGVFNYDGAQSGVNNGGTIFNGWVRQYDGAVNIVWFGASTSLDDNQSIIQDVFTNFRDIYIPAGVYTLLSSISIPQGTTITGAARQSYGSYSSATPSTLLFSGLPADDWCIDVAINQENITIRNINIEGDWTTNGVNFIGANREILLEDVSIKSVKYGISTNAFWVSEFNRVAIRCTGTGVQFLGGGTTNKLNLFLEGKSDASTADRMDIGFSTVGAKLFNTSITGFCQRANVGMNFEDSPQVAVHDFDFENVLRCVELYNLDEARLKFNSCNYYLIATATAFRISGAFSDLAQVYITNVQGLTKHFSGKFVGTLDWTTERFIEDNSATWANGLGILEIDYHTYDTVTYAPAGNGIDAGILPNLLVKSSSKLAVSEWTDYTPSIWNGTNVVIGSSTGRYKVDGDMVTVQFNVDITSSDADASAVEITLPSQPDGYLTGAVDWDKTTFFSLSTLGNIVFLPSAFASIRCYEAVTGSAYTFTESNSTGIINGTVTYKI